MSLEQKRGPGIADAQSNFGLRAVVFIIAGVQALLPLGLIVFIARHANPMGDGMEWVGVFPALLLAAVFAVPPLIWSLHNRRLIAGLLVAIAGALLSLAFYVEVWSELGHLTR